MDRLGIASNDNDGDDGPALVAKILKRLPPPPFEEYRSAGEDWATDPNDAEANTAWAEVNLPRSAE